MSVLYGLERFGVPKIYHKENLSFYIYRFSKYKKAELVNLFQTRQTENNEEQVSIAYFMRNVFFGFVCKETSD